MTIKRRDFILGSAALAACRGPEMARVWTPNDPRQPAVLPVIPEKRRVIYTQQPPASPVHLSASLVLPSGSNGAPQPAALMNPMGQDMELLEIKFELSGAFVAGDETVTPGFGGTVWCELAMGGVKLTNGAIPVWNFGRAENLQAETFTDDENSLGFSAFSWRLPRPLFVPAGAVVIPNFTHTGFIPNTLNVRIGYSARTVFTKPKRIYVPWVAKYASKSFNPIEDAGVDLSSDLDLVNPFSEPVHLQRFVGRTLMLRANGTADEDGRGFAAQYLNVRMTDSYGRPIVRSYTPFRSVFGALTRTWELENGAQMDPKAFYIVNLRKDAMTTDTAGAAAQAFVSVVGWRELEGL